VPSVPIRAVVLVGVADMASERPRLVRLPVNEEGQVGVESRGYNYNCEVSNSFCICRRKKFVGTGRYQTCGPCGDQDWPNPFFWKWQLVQVRFCTRLRIV